MKTDVIVLGAGASVSAGFPTNEGLANYVIYDLPKRNIPPSEGKDEFHIDAFHREWRELSRILGESNCLSIDEFCQISHSDASLVARMKQALRLALIDHANDWWKPDVEYRRFITTLFKPNTIIPENDSPSSTSTMTVS